MLRKAGLLATEVCAPGGIQSFMLRLTEVLGALVRDGDASKAFCVSLNDTTADLRHHASFPTAVATLGAGRSKWRLARQALRVVNGAEVLLVGHVALSPLALALKSLGFVRRYCVILHGVEAWAPAGWLRRLALRHADRLVATTRYTADVCARANHLPSSHFSIIPLCADERPVSPAQGFRLNGDFKLLCVARQDASERYKGFEPMFEALALLKGMHERIHLNLVGDGDDQLRLRAHACMLGVADRVTFWGRLAEENLAAAYEACDVYVMPSQREGFGIVFLEAMRQRKPCIGGRHGGTPEVIDHGRTGFLVDHGDAEGLAQRIRLLHASPELCAQMGEQGCELLYSRFSAAAFEAAYRGMLLGTIAQPVLCIPDQ